MNIQELNVFPFYAAPVKAPEVFDLDELDSYSAPIPVKKEPSPKAPTSSKPSSSKAVTTPKPPPATSTRAPSARKRKETDSPLSLRPFHMKTMDSMKPAGL